MAVFLVLLMSTWMPIAFWKSDICNFDNVFMPNNDMGCFDDYWFVNKALRGGGHGTMAGIAQPESFCPWYRFPPTEFVTLRPFPQS